MIRVAAATVVGVAFGWWVRGYMEANVARLLRDIDGLERSPQWAP
jgi:hypothetical protein